MTPEEKKAYNKAYYRANKEKFAMYKKTLSIQQRERKNEKNREYYYAHKEPKQEIPAFLKITDEEKKQSTAYYGKQYRKAHEYTLKKKRDAKKEAKKAYNHAYYLKHKHNN